MFVLVHWVAGSQHLLKDFLMLALRSVFVLLFTIVLGCSAENQDLIPVKGTVTLDEKVIVGATITFVPVGDTKGQGGATATNQDGEYEVFYPTGGKGLPAGEYKVTINYVTAIDGSRVKEDPDIPPIERQGKEHLLPKYSDPEKTELRARIAPNSGPYDFKLVSGKKK
jgi:hypothetical protein